MENMVDKETLKKFGVGLGIGVAAGVAAPLVATAALGAVGFSAGILEYKHLLETWWQEVALQVSLKLSKKILLKMENLSVF